MARSRGDNSGRGRRPRATVQPAGSNATPTDRSSPVFDVVRRALTLGLSGLFTTNEVMRRAVGDAIPRDWVDFAVDQSERTRSDFIERLAGELARTIESIDLAGLAEKVLEGRVIEINAQIQLHPKGARGSGGSPFRLAVVKGDERK
jgi:hypothetical protein